MKHFRIRHGIMMSLMAFLMMPMASSAQEDEDVRLTVYCSYDDSSVGFDILDIRKIAFGQDGLTFMFIDGMYEDRFFEYGDIGSMKFSGITNAIDNVKKDKNVVDIVYDGTRLRISGCKDNTAVKVFDISGRPVISRIVSGNAFISTARLQSGVYILRVNNKTFKFNKI